MSEELCVRRIDGGDRWRLFLRSYESFDRPDYTHVEYLTEDQAIAMVKTGIAHDLFGHVHEVQKLRSKK